MKFYESDFRERRLSRFINETIIITSSGVISQLLVVPSENCSHAVVRFMYHNHVIQSLKISRKQAESGTLLAAAFFVRFFIPFYAKCRHAKLISAGIHFSCISEAGMHSNVQSTLTRGISLFECFTRSSDDVHEEGRGGVAAVLMTFPPIDQ